MSADYVPDLHLADIVEVVTDHGGHASTLVSPSWVVEVGGLDCPDLTGAHLLVRRGYGMVCSGCGLTEAALQRAERERRSDEQ